MEDINEAKAAVIVGQVSQGIKSPSEGHEGLTGGQSRAGLS